MLDLIRALSEFGNMRQQAVFTVQVKGVVRVHVLISSHVKSVLLSIPFGLCFCLHCRHEHGTLDKPLAHAPIACLDLSSNDDEQRLLIHS